MIKRALLSIGLLILGGFANKAPAEWGRTPDNPLRFGGGLFPKMISDGAGGVWITSLFDGPQIGAVPFDRYGETNWERWVEILPGVRNGGPVLTLAPNSDLFVASNGQYYDIPNDDGYVNVHIQRINHNGDRLWGDNGVKVGGDTTAQSLDAVISDGRDGIIVLYCYLDDPRQILWAPYAQRISGEGERLWDENRGSIIGWRRLVVSWANKIRSCADDHGGIILISAVSIWIFNMLIIENFS